MLQLRKSFSRINGIKHAGVVASLAMGAAFTVFSVLPVAAAPGGSSSQGKTFSAESTTLDACGYFVGTQTARATSASTSGTITTTVQHGTWTGVENNYVFTPVSSLGTVQGSFTEKTTSDSSTGLVTGTETFNSNAGKIDQTFSYGPSVQGGYSVDVTATRDLSFMTSSTAGECYQGTFPRS